MTKLLLALFVLTGCVLTAAEEKSPQNFGKPPETGNARYHDGQGKNSGYSHQQGNGTTLYYDSAGKKSGHAQENGNTTRYYDAKGRFSGTARKSGSNTNYYDSTGKRTGYSRVSGNTTYFYDAQGRLVSREVAGSNGQVTIYDATDKRIGTRAKK